MKKQKEVQQKLFKIIPSKKKQKKIKQLIKKKIKKKILNQPPRKKKLLMLNRNRIVKIFRKKKFHQNKKWLKVKILKRLKLLRLKMIH